MDVGTILHTKDGGNIGNAIICSKSEIKQLVPRVEVWELETDFGNRCRFTESEILAWFNVGPTVDLEKWRSDRLQLIQVKHAQG